MPKTPAMADATVMMIFKISPHFDLGLRLFLLVLDMTKLRIKN